MHWEKEIALLTCYEMVLLGSRFEVMFDALPEVFLLCDDWCSVARSLLEARVLIDVP